LAGAEGQLTGTADGAQWREKNRDESL
jgi:hypothetical protein